MSNFLPGGTDPFGERSAMNKDPRTMPVSYTHLDVYKRQVLDNAHIVQRGTHAELIQQKGLYADFVSARQEAIGWKLAQ